MRSSGVSSSDPATRRSIERFQAGVERERSFQRLFERHYRLVRFHFQRHGAALDEAEDLTQETFLRVYRGLDAFRGESGFVTWLLRIADNVRHRSWQDRQRAQRGPAERPLEHLAGSTPDPFDDMLGKERYRRVVEELRTMPSQMQRCASLRLFQGLQYQEIARVLQISLDAVRVQLTRARRRLREALDPELSEKESP